MLILQRSKGEKVFIGENITVTITDIDYISGRVKLGFDAPENIIIDREEVYYRRKADWPPLPKYLSEDDIKCQLAHNTHRGK